MAGVRLQDLDKVYSLNGREIKALNGINLEIAAQSFVTIVGQSGCGKTTLLRILSGLEEKTAGAMIFSDPPGAQVRTGIVFQEPRLMPWLTVQQNMVFSLRGCTKGIIAKQANKYLNLLGLKEFQDAYPGQISGGMAQRAALGRTLCFEPRLILMDEPLSALDAFTRRKLQQEILDIYLLEKQTIVFVTHDVDEAVYLGQKVVVMDKGKVVDEISVNLPYPRDPYSRDYARLKERILDAILQKEAGTRQNGSQGGKK